MPEPVSITPVPFFEAIGIARRRKVLLPDDFYAAVQQQAVDNAFTVGSLTSLNQIQGVRDALATVLADGKTFKEFQDLVARAGVDFKIPSVVYRNAIQSNTMAGRWIHIQEFEDSFPFLIYDSIDDGRTRPAHAAMDGYVAPVRSDIWLNWYPPNGHNCRCTVNALTREQAVARGYVGAPPPAGDPDPGWRGNVGVSYSQQLLSELEDLNTDQHVWKPLLTSAETKEQLDKEYRALLRRAFGRGALLAGEGAVLTSNAANTPQMAALWLFLNDEKSFKKMNKMLQNNSQNEILSLVYYGLRDAVEALPKIGEANVVHRYYPVSAVRSILDSHKPGTVVEYNGMATGVVGDIPSGEVGVVMEISRAVGARRTPFSPTEQVQTVVWPPRARFLVNKVEQRGDVWYIFAEEVEPKATDVVL